jgi:hypothetical protein
MADRVRRRLVPAPDLSSQDSFASWDFAREFTGHLGVGRQIECPRQRMRVIEESQVVTVLKKLQHPLALVFQGFILGGVLFWTTQGQAAAAPAASPAPITASLSAN